MLAEVGPGSYNARPEVSAKTMHGDDLIAPLRVSPNFALATAGVSPIGFALVAADHKVVGTIVDVWVDRSESIARYYEVKLAGSDRSVLVPVPFADVQGKRRRVVVKALLAENFANAPTLSAPDRVTMLEEDRIAAYFAAGTLYATKWRTESML
jgi:photosynthetic reaction center H subunit